MNWLDDVMSEIYLKNWKLIEKLKSDNRKVQCPLVNLDVNKQNAASEYKRDSQSNESFKSW